MAVDSKGKRTISIVAILVVIMFSALVVVNAVVRGISVAVGVGILGAVVIVSLVGLLGAKGVVWVGGRGECGALRRPSLSLGRGGEIHLARCGRPSMAGMKVSCYPVALLAVEKNLKGYKVMSVLRTTYSERSWTVVASELRLVRTHLYTRFVILGILDPSLLTTRPKAASPLR